MSKHRCHQYHAVEALQVRLQQELLQTDHIKIDLLPVIDALVTRPLPAQVSNLKSLVALAGVGDVPVWEVRQVVEEG